MARVFLSYVYEDYRYAAQIMDWARSGQLGYGIEIITETDDVRQHGTAAIWIHLRSRMRQCDGVLALVGDNSHNHDWVHQEVHYFASAGKPIACVRLPNTYGAAPPEIRGRSLYSFTPSSIRQAIADMF